MSSDWINSNFILEPDQWAEAAEWSGRGARFPGNIMLSIFDFEKCYQLELKIYALILLYFLLYYFQDPIYNIKILSQSKW